MTRSRFRAGGLATLLALTALAASGCGVATQPDAVAFVNQHKAHADDARAAIRMAEDELGILSRPPTRPQLRRLGRAARVAGERINDARAGLPTYQAAEEELQIAESELGVGANEVSQAMAELIIYARHPRAASLARYRQYMLGGREQWDQAVIELWRLARQPRPPTF